MGCRVEDTARKGGRGCLGRARSLSMSLSLYLSLAISFSDSRSLGISGHNETFLCKSIGNVCTVPDPDYMEREAPVAHHDPVVSEHWTVEAFVRVFGEGFRVRGYEAGILI